MEPDPHDAALKEAARVAAMKRVSTAKFAARTGGNYELAALLVDAVYKALPPPPEPAPPASAKP